MKRLLSGTVGDARIEIDGNYRWVEMASPAPPERHRHIGQAHDFLPDAINAGTSLTTQEPTANEK
jgi:hypothetical protein